MSQSPHNYSNLLARITLDTSIDQIYWTNSEGKFLYANHAAVKETGYSPGELLSMSVFDLAPDFSQSIWAAHWEELKLKGALTFECNQRRKDGVFHEVEVSTIYVCHDEMEFTSAYVRDISDRKRTERLLRDSEARFRDMADSAPVMIWMSDEDKLCTYFNKQWLDFTGRSMEQEIGNGWAEGVHPDDLERCLAIYVTSFDERKPFSMEYRLRHSSGDYRWVFDNGVPRFAGDSAFVGYIGACKDITGRRQIEQSYHEQQARLNNLANDLLLAEERERRRIAAGLHDQIVQELAIGKIMISEKMNKNLPEECRLVHERVRDILASAIHDCRTLIFDLSPPLLYEVGLASALEELGERLGREHGFCFELKVRGEHVQLGEILRVSLYQMLRELLMNVVMHANASQVVMLFSSHSDELEIVIKDDGIGFDTSSNYYKSVKPGHGYGLFSIQQRLVTLGGTISIDSAPGTGTCISLGIPVSLFNSPRSSNGGCS